MLAVAGAGLLTFPATSAAAEFPDEAPTDPAPEQQADVAPIDPILWGVPINGAPPIGDNPVDLDVPEGFDNAGPPGAGVPRAALDDTSDGVTADASPVGGGDAVSSEAVEAREAEALATLDVSAAAACSWYVSPSGRTSNSGRSSGSPLPLRTAAGRTRAGETVCLLGGVYYLSTPLYIGRSGTSSAYVTYRSEGGTADLRWTGGRSSQELIQVLDGVRYIEIRGMRFNGADRVNAGVKCSTRSHHMRVLYNTITNTGQAGVTAKGCDYTTVHGNAFYRVGSGNGAGSGVSINSPIWLDGYSGFHSFVTNNVISGTYDNQYRREDGNGIIVDRGSNTPHILIANNVAFGNFNKCIHAYRASNVWIINNTCYRNNQSGHPDAEINLYLLQNGHVINNVAYARSTGYAYKQEYSSGTYQRNVGYSGRSPSRLDASSVRTTNPLFNDPFSITSWSSAPPPSAAGSRLAPRSGSPLLAGAIDPRYASGITSTRRAGVTQFLSVDIQGNARPRNGWDIGAYER